MMSFLLTEDEVRDICLSHRGDNQRARAIQIALIDKMRNEPVGSIIEGDAYAKFGAMASVDECVDDNTGYWKNRGYTVTPLYRLPTPQELENE